MTLIITEDPDHLDHLDRGYLGRGQGYLRLSTRRRKHSVPHGALIADKLISSLEAVMLGIFLALISR